MTANRKPGGLPKLNTSKELSRRDSLSSSRTRDSGYNSDFDVSCSPLDYLDSDQRMYLLPRNDPTTDISSEALFASLPLLSGTLFDDKPSSVQTFRALHKTPPFQQLCVTSSPASECPIPENQSLNPKGSCLFKPHRGAIEAANTLRCSNSTADDNDIEQWIKDNLPLHNRPNKRVLSIASQSSSSSCEMYTNTDVSDDEHCSTMRQQALPRATMKTINIIMRRIEVNLGFITYTHSNRDNTANPSAGSAPMTSHINRTTTQGIGKRKPRSDDHHPPNEDEQDGPNKRRRGSLATVESSETGARFACPFYKHEPSRYRNRRTCPGPGWPTVHRMKEHLYRGHVQSVYCPRCYTMFDADLDLSNHLRSAQCNVSAPEPIEGIDRETLKALRKRSSALRLEEDKWRDVYHLLFPEVAMEDIPSPCK